VSLEERAFAVAEVEVPEPLEPGVEAERGHLVGRGHDVGVPAAQGLGVVATDVLDVHHRQRGGTAAMSG